MTELIRQPLPPPDPRVEAELAFRGVHTDAAPIAQAVAGTMGAPVSEIVEQLGHAVELMSSLREDAHRHHYGT
jgi:hypothetical protein